MWRLIDLAGLTELSMVLSSGGLVRYILVACATFIYFLSAGFLPDRLFVSIEVMKEEEKI